MGKNINEHLIEYEDIEIYNMVRSGVLRRFPNNFWDGFDAYKTSGEITRYMFEKILKWDLEQVKSEVSIDVFFDNRLGGMLSVVFNGRLYDALLNAYPELEEWIKSKKKEEPKHSIVRYTDEELIQKLQNKAKEYNKIPTIREMENPEGSTYITRFGTWRKALVAAELIEDIFKDVDDSEEAKYKCEQLLKKFTFENDRLPTKEEVFKLISEGELITYFNSLPGLYYYLNNDYTKDELINILRYKAKKLNRLPINRDMKVPRAIKFVEAFGNWDKALKSSGLN